eukprot:m.56686 g.56686  ORF g.56686 m.56686 type:complete len:724 (-) comp7028_c0_seq2:20-2191(-)
MGITLRQVALVAFVFVAVQLLVAFFLHAGDPGAAGALADRRNNERSHSALATPYPAIPPAAVLSSPGWIVEPWVPPATGFNRTCEPEHKDARSALERVRSDKCRDVIREVACRNEQNALYPPAMHLHRNPACNGPHKNPVPDEQPDPSPVRIAFLFVVNGRSLRQIKRLFRMVYRSHHWYLFHVDIRSQYLYHTLAEFVAPFPNAWVTSWQLGSIWGAANLYEVYMRAFSDLLQFHWDYFINLSETDLPIQTVEQVEEFLRGYRSQKINFLKSHGKDHDRFVRKQGLDRTFVFCEFHMWRVGARTLPTDLVIEGGSDWYILHRSFCDYVTHSGDPLISELRAYYDHSLLAAESFFHVVLANSDNCNTFIFNNFRFANWKRKLGCRCQYKAVVDWCGCSPNVFKIEDKSKFQDQVKKNIMFSRKFDPRISMSVINWVEENMLGIQNDLVKDYYWQSEWLLGEKKDTTKATYFYSFARLATQNLVKHVRHDACGKDLEELSEVHLVTHHDEFLGYTVGFHLMDHSGKQYQYEALASPVYQDPMAFRNESGRDTDGYARLKKLIVGTNWDEKERIFQRFGGMLSVYDQLTAVQLWKTGQATGMIVQWTPPVGSPPPPYMLKIAGDWAVSYHKPSMNRPIHAGRWTVHVIDEKTKLEYARVEFPVVPTHPDVEPNDGVDGLVDEFWDIQDVCSVEPGDRCFNLPPCAETAWSSFRTNSQVGRGLEQE